MASQGEEINTTGMCCQPQFLGEGQGNFFGGTGQQITLGIWGQLITLLYAYRRIIAVKWCWLDFIWGTKNKIRGQLQASIMARACMKD